MASILDAHETASKFEKTLILLTFLGWHLFCQDNTKRKTPKWVSFVLLVVWLVPHGRRGMSPKGESLASKKKRLIIVFSPRDTAPQEVEGARVSSDARRL